MSAQKDLIREKSRMSSYLSLTFPEFEKLVSKINSSKSINFLNTFPTPESILKYSKDDFIEKCRAELKRFSVEILKDIYLAAEKSIGVNLFKENLILPNYIESFSNANNLEKKRFEQCNAMAIREEGYSKIKAIKGMGPKIVTGILLSMGNYKAFSKASQITKLTGLNLVDKTSGSSVHSPAHISHQGNRDLRYWAYCGALQVIKYPGPFQKMYKRKTKGKEKNGSGKKSLIAVSDKLVRTIWAILKKGGEYNPDYESDTRK